jgi:hypothetical protein
VELAGLGAPREPAQAPSGGGDAAGELVHGGLGTLDGQPHRLPYARGEPADGAIHDPVVEDRQGASQRERRPDDQPVRGQLEA